MTDLIKILNNPEEHYPGNFDTPQRANALLTGLCQDAAKEIERLNYEVDAIPAIKEERDALQAEVLEQCRIIAMGAEREDALRAELTRLKASIALDWMAKNARDLGLDYEPAVQERNFCERCGKRLGGDGHIHTCTPPAAQPAPVQDLPFGVGGGLVAIKTLLGRDPCVHANTAIEMIDAILKEHPVAQPAPLTCKHEWFRTGAMEPGECRCINCGMWNTTTPPVPQPVPVKTYHDGKPWPVAPKPWVDLTDEEIDTWNIVGHETLREFVRTIEAKLKEKNHG